MSSLPPDCSLAPLAGGHVITNFRQPGVASHRMGCLGNVPCATRGCNDPRLEPLDTCHHPVGPWTESFAVPHESGIGIASLQKTGAGSFSKQSASGASRRARMLCGNIFFNQLPEVGAPEEKGKLAMRSLLIFVAICFSAIAFAQS